MWEIHCIHHPVIHSSYATEQLQYYICKQQLRINYEWRMKTSCMLGILAKEKSADSEMNLLNRGLL